MLLLSVAPARAATFTAASQAALVTAINSANGNSEADTINITANITLSAELPQITSAITINGNGRTISGNDSYQIFYVRFGGGSLTINNLTLTNGFEGVDGGQGGAIYAQGDVTLNQVVIRNSRSTTEGGAIYLSHSQADLVVNRSAFYNNSSITRGGGALYLNGKTHKITNSTFYNNSIGAGEFGAALTLGASRDTATFELNHVTITGNSGGLSALAVNRGTLTMRNSIVYGNAIPDCVRDVDNASLTVNSGNIHTLSAPAATELVNCGTPFSTADPLLSSSATGSPPYFTIAANSPARNAATCISSITEDQRGVTRPQESSCDIGAFEYVPPPVQPPAPVQPTAPDQQSASAASKQDNKAYTPTVSTCTTLDGIVASNISESTQCQRVNAMQIANPAFKDSDFVDAVDVWGWVTPNSEICFEAQGSAIKFIDTTAMPRTTSELIAYSRQDTVCASIDGPGILVLLPGDAPAAGSGQAQTASSASRGLSGCMVRLTEKLNFRETPGGEVMQVLAEDMKLTAEARTDDWFKVDFWGKKGWISADYVVTEGACG